jgi:hypothetical protein
VYLLYLDESGTHGGSPVFVLAGVAVHEQDAWHFQQRLDGVLATHLPRGLNPLAFELHAADIKSPRRAIPGRRGASEWVSISGDVRFRVLRAVRSAIGSYGPLDPQYPFALFGAVVDRASYADYEERAYEEVLNKFDELLTRQARASGVHQRGIVVHDKAVLERDVQDRADMWRHMRGRIGRLTHLADVPLFADSRASRLIQASDYVAWALWRHYVIGSADEWSRDLWPRVDSVGGVMHGLIHVTPAFRAGCACRPCASRRAGGPVPIQTPPPLPTP